MTNIRTSGFDSPSQMREYLEEAEGAIQAGRSAEEHLAMKRAIRELRGQIDQLRQRLQELQREQVPVRTGGWLRAAATMTLTMALGRIANGMRLGVLGAVAVPLVVARVNRIF